MNVTKSRAQQWAEFRFSVVGQLLSNPPEKGDLAGAMRELANQEWQHPFTKSPFKISVGSIERWYYRASREHYDSVAILAKRKRSDTGSSRVLREVWQKSLREQYFNHPSWTWKLHAENLWELMNRQSPEAVKPSYDSVRRFMKSVGLIPKKRRRFAIRDGQRVEVQANSRDREVRSYESPYVGALYHCDFHFGKRQVLTKKGEWITPIAFGVIDDHSRLICHLQWYTAETSEVMVHALTQAFLKRGLPRTLHCDNGAAMRSQEIHEGLLRLGVVLQRTAPYSPEANGKIESFWGILEGRLMAMLENKQALTLHDLNRYTQAWVELEYNKREHSQINAVPYSRFVEGKSVLRRSPDQSVLVEAFRMDLSRTQRRSDGTVSVDGIRFEVPGQYRHMEQLTIRYARWNPTFAHLIDPVSGKQLCKLDVENRNANADAHRRSLPAESANVGERHTKRDEVAPLLDAMLQEFSASGLPPAFLPKEER